MFKLIALVMAIVTLALAPSTARAADSRVRLEGRARQSNPSLKYNARYEEESSRQRFKVEIENVRPGTKHAVTAGGKPMGVITANEFGRGELNLHVNWNGTNVSSLPHFTPGTVVTVDKLSATLVRQ